MSLRALLYWVLFFCSLGVVHGEDADQPVIGVTGSYYSENHLHPGGYAGVELVYTKLVSMLEAFDIQRIDAVGQPFDPNLHEAILQEPSDDHPEGFVTRELQTGYQRKDKVIRPAMVVVAR